MVLAIQKTDCRVVAVGGGVTANKLLRSALERLEKRHRVRVLIPSAAAFAPTMRRWAAVAWEHIERNDIADLDLDARPNIYRQKQK